MGFRVQGSGSLGFALWAHLRPQGSGKGSSGSFGGTVVATAVAVVAVVAAAAAEAAVVVVVWQQQLLQQPGSLGLNSFNSPPSKARPPNPTVQRT